MKSLKTRIISKVSFSVYSEKSMLPKVQIQI